MNDGPNNVILLNGAGDPVLVSDAPGCHFSAGLAPLVQAGGAIVDSIPVRWGVSAGGVQFDPFHGAVNAQFFQFAAAQSVTPAAVLQQTGPATFNTVVAFTKLVDDKARIGGTASLIAGLWFGANPTVNRYDMNVTDAGGRNWTGARVMPQSPASFAGSQTNSNRSVSCGGACPRTGTGKASGFFIGPNRGGMISSYNLGAGTAGVTGSIAVT